MQSKRELLNTQLNSSENADETNGNKENSGEELIQRKKVEKTDFEIITRNNKHFLAFGKYRITEDHENIEDLYEMVEEKPWRLIGILCSTIATDIIMRGREAYEEEVLKNSEKM